MTTLPSRRTHNTVVERILRTMPIVLILDYIVLGEPNMSKRWSRRKAQSYRNISLFPLHLSLVANGDTPSLQECLLYLVPHGGSGPCSQPGAHTCALPP